jgi:GNAT superfamily N-acetyltransferase
MGAEPEITITLHDDVPREAGTIVDAGLGKANEYAAPFHEVQPLSAVARLPTGEIAGGIVGRTWGACCEIQQVWVHADHRRRGLGTRLIREFERRAESRGCRKFYLETFSFQAPRLYLALGYTVGLAIAGFPETIVKYIMVRDPTGGDAHPGAPPPCADARHARPT